MTEIPSWVFTVANASIAVVFAVILLNLYSKQTKDFVQMASQWTERLAGLTEQTIRAMTEVKGAVEGMQSVVVTLQGAVTALCEEVRRQQGVVRVVESRRGGRRAYDETEPGGEWGHQEEPLLGSKV